MEGEGLAHDGIPGQVMRRLGKIGTFVAVCADLLALVDLEIGEKAAYEGVGNSVEYFPAIGGLSDVGSEYVIEFLLREESYKILDVAADAEIYTSVHIELNVEISHIVLIGAEEELKTAVLAGGSERIVYLGSDIILNGREVKEKLLAVVADLSLCADALGIAQVGDLHSERGDFAPVGRSVCFFDDVCFHIDLRSVLSNTFINYNTKVLICQVERA